MLIDELFQTVKQTHDVALLHNVAANRGTAFGRVSVEWLVKRACSSWLLSLT